MSQPHPLQELLLEFISELRTSPSAKIVYLASYADIMRLRGESRRWFIGNLGFLRQAYQQLDAERIEQEIRTITRGNPRVGTPDSKQTLLVELGRLTWLEFELELQSLMYDESTTVDDQASKLSRTRISVPSE